MLSYALRRLNRERVTELQQQVEDLQKALQSEAAKPDDVSVFHCFSTAVPLHTSAPWNNARCAVENKFSLINGSQYKNAIWFSYKHNNIQGSADSKLTGKLVREKSAVI